VVEVKENVKPETDVKKSTEYRKNMYLQHKKDQIMFDDNDLN